MSRFSYEAPPGATQSGSSGFSSTLAIPSQATLGLGPPPTPALQSAPPGMGLPGQRREPQPPKVLQDGREAPVAGVDGNWACVQCSHTNFAKRRSCHLCHAEKVLSVPESANEPQNIYNTLGEDAVDEAAATAMTPVALMEKELDFDNLKWKLAAVFRKAAKGLAFTQPLLTNLEAFASKAFSQLVNTFGEREWLPVADLTIVFDAAIKTTFPPEVLGQLEPQVLSTLILGAYDRGFDEARAQPLMWEAVPSRVEGKKAQNKVYAALEQARSDAIKVVCNPAPVSEADLAIAQLPVLEKVQRFIAMWVNGLVEPVSKLNQGDPSNVLPPDKAISLFQHLVKSDAIPASLQRELHFQGIMIPKPYPFINTAVKEAYQPYEERAAKKRKMQASQPKTAYCWYFYNGHCGFSNQCMYAHNESEIYPPHMAAWAPWSIVPPGKGAPKGY